MNADKAKMKTVKLFFLSMLLMGQLAGAPLITPEAMARHYKEPLVRVFEYRDLLKGVHPFVSNLYPIAVAQDGQFYVFDLDSTRTQYRLVTHAPTNMPVPEGVRAAFPLDFYGGKAACIVTGDVFDTPLGYLTIFHEFIHCHQWETVEPALRETLPLARHAAEKQDFMWEMNHPFPYDDDRVEETYRRMLGALDRGDEEALWLNSKALQQMLSPFDYQYMVWQQWKEGFALFIENKLRQQLGHKINRVGRNGDFSRLSFYAGGEALIRFLVDQDPDLSTDLEALFRKMMEIG
ncbi:MAG: hypothetical protein V2I46_09840 [Bacteroides sp.]|jgi:hypothetical protein|nr:hypothetical protein [Bacteroides sp.]